MKKLMLFSILFMTAAFIGCNKSGDSDTNYYYGDNIDDIIKIKGFLKDIDCGKGVVMSWYDTSSYNSGSGSDTMYCDELAEDLEDIDGFYKGLGNVSSAKYDPKKRSVIIKSVIRYQTYFRNSYYSVTWYWVTRNLTTTFYTKGSH